MKKNKKMSVVSLDGKSSIIEIGERTAQSGWQDVYDCDCCIGGFSK